MAIASMTGFAREAGAAGSSQWAWELKSVNGRGLDLRLRLPPGFDAVSEDARAQVQKAFVRGQCQLNLTITRGPSPPRVRVNEEIFSALADAVGRLKLPAGVTPASVDGLLAVRGVVEIEDEAETLGAELAADLKRGIARCIDSLREARLAEGRALSGVLAGQLDAMERHVAAVEAAPARRPDAVRAKLEGQIAALLGAAPALDPDRLHQEAVLMATKADVREELDRLSVHIASARELLAQGGAVGRRLDFLAQEMGREANTLCAKANDVSLSRIGLDLKAVVEQFREQVQNVE
ncbi:MAG TPA: YicC/YloC family endoribonuclease [Beijerinckiaceae bacterium]|jgi:uncharacterized protein (TIGR00255 family)